MNFLPFGLRGCVCLIIFQLASLTLCLLLSSVVEAQDTLTGAFEGIISNSQNGAAIEGASVEIINQQTGLII
ncbi:MAG TPA: hypothetical protein VHD88_08995, partial [Pyrinomonadaceae bacterium]|nr:hypothetical protein [Pyrinomonadaceae bacterium]